MELFFFISFSDNSFLVYRNTTNFCILVWYPAALLKSFISFNSFLVASLGFAIDHVICRQRKFYFFATWIPFISCSRQAALAKTSSTMLNRSGEGGHPFIVPDLRGKAFNF